MKHKQTHVTSQTTVHVNQNTCAFYSFVVNISFMQKETSFVNVWVAKHMLLSVVRWTLLGACSKAECVATERVSVLRVDKMTISTELPICIWSEEFRQNYSGDWIVSYKFNGIWNIYLVFKKCSYPSMIRNHRWYQWLHTKLASFWQRIQLWN